ncbi:ABC transporter permease [Vallitalea guaymasensis]|uniref:ABC transporter permease n=1 Tax=Vallitalea guaymasensis TaxID=1185412 RepID=UPI000DE21605|nr:ABC transporter permease [Vallitalea guaymasensis]
MKLRHIIVKDVKKIIYDKKLLAIILLMPIVLMTILGFSLNNMFGDGGTSIGNINVAIVKNYDALEDMARFEETVNKSFFTKDLDEKSRESLLSIVKDYNIENIFFEYLDSDNIQEVMTYTVQDEEKAREMLESKEVTAVVILPENYIYNTYMNYALPVRNIVDVEILKHTDNSIKGSIVEAVIDGFMGTMNNYSLDKEVFINKVQEYSDLESAFEGIPYLMEELTENVQKNLDIKDIDVEGKKNLSSFQYYAVAMMAMFILYSASNGGRLLLEEKENITYQRNRVAGVPLSKIMISNFFMICIVAILQSVVMILYSSIVLKINWGDIGLVLLSILSSSLAIGGLGIFISVITLIVGNYKFANVFELGIIQFMALIGGSFVPIETLPSFMNKLSYFSTSGVAIKIYTGIMRNNSLADMWNYYAILIGTGVGFIMVSAIMVKLRREAI